MMSESSSWYVAQTHPQAEGKAATNLIRQGFETYLPRYLKTVRHARRLNVVKAPLFPRYIFVRLDISQPRWRVINSTIGVTRLIGYNNMPTPLTGDIVEGLKGREDANGFCEIINPSACFKVGDTVRVLRGAFDSCLGIFEARTDNDRVAILLEMLGRKVRIVTDAEMIELA
jgi:transcriptional antiterminator RfaH